jgi:hypothetical protein
MWIFHSESLRKLLFEYFIIVLFPFRKNAVKVGGLISKSIWEGNQLVFLSPSARSRKNVLPHYTLLPEVICKDWAFQAYRVLFIRFYILSKGVYVFMNSLCHVWQKILSDWLLQSEREEHWWNNSVWKITKLFSYSSNKSFGIA